MKEDMGKAKIVVITGPTATGKTALGILLAQRLNGEIVSADSMQIYRRMDIGTAKPSLDELSAASHHMIDIAEPFENRSVAEYTAEANACIADIIKRGKLPIIVGGTGLYIDSILSGRSFAPADTDGEVRQELNERYDEIGGKAMRIELSQFDPTRAEKLKDADKKRIVRAYEIFLLSGITATEHDAKTKETAPPYDAAVFWLDYKSREDLYSRINERVDAMVKNGLIEEVKSLLDSGLSPTSTSLQAIGYKEFLGAFLGEITAEAAAEQVKQKSRNYAKRQMTWLRAKPDIKKIVWDKEPDLEYGMSEVTAYLSQRGFI